MTAREIFFGFSGRMNRAKYWGYSLLLTLGFCVLIGLFIGIAVAVNIEENVPVIILLVVLFIAAIVLFLIVNSAIGVKRLHDRNKSGFWLFLYYYVPTALQQPASAWDKLDTTGRGAVILFVVAAIVIWIWGLIDLGCLRGTPGPNAYGPDPLDRTSG